MRELYMVQDRKAQTPDHLFDDAWNSMNRELSAESERAAAIVGCALLDDRLGDLLGEYLVQNDDANSDLFDSEKLTAPLGTFSSRILAAYAIGLIDRGARDALGQLRRIRNSFAHDLGCGFADQAIASRCAEAYKICQQAVVTSRASDPREQFQCAASFLSGMIAERRYWIAEFGLRGSFDYVCRATFARDREPCARIDEHQLKDREG